jgi:hypothetical protein
MKAGTRRWSGETKISARSRQSSNMGKSIFWIDAYGFGFSVPSPPHRATPAARPRPLPPGAWPLLQFLLPLPGVVHHPRTLPQHDPYRRPAARQWINWARPFQSPKRVIADTTLSQNQVGPRPIKFAPQRASSLAHSMRQLPASSKCSHEKHDAPKVLRLDHLHRVITKHGDSYAAGG